MNLWIKLQAALLALSLVLGGGLAAASPATRQGPAWAAHAQTTVKHELGRLDVVKSTTVADAASQAAQSRPTRVVTPETKPVPMPDIDAVKSAIRRPPQRGKLKAVVDIESRVKAVWLSQGDATIAIPIEVMKGGKGSSPIQRRQIALAAKEAYTMAAGWSLPSSIVVDMDTNRIGLRKGDKVIYLEDSRVRPAPPPVTTQRRILRRPRRIARR